VKSEKSLTSPEIRKTVRCRVPQIAFARIARKILGPRYELSLVICGDSLGKRLNVERRKRNYTPNVLTFPLTKNEGEIFLNVLAAARESRRFKVPLRERIIFLFIHACLHLTGLKHGRRMEQMTTAMLKRIL